MTIQELLTIIYILSGFMGFILVLVIFIKRHEIISFFFPEGYAVVTMLEADNNIQTWLQRKNPSLKFKFNNGSYNMYELQEVENKALNKVQKLVAPDGTEIPIDKPKTEDEDKPVKEYKKLTAVYREGRLGHFFYNEGNSDPLDFRGIKTLSNPQLDEQLQKTEVMELFTGGSKDFWEILTKYVIPIVLLIAVIVIIILLTKNNAGTQVPVQPRG